MIPKETPIREASLKLWVIAAALAIGLLPLWKVCGVETCRCASGGCTTAALGWNAPSQDAENAPSNCAAGERASCCCGGAAGGASSMTDSEGDAPPSSPTPGEPGGCDCPLCFCTASTIQLVVPTIEVLEAAGMRVAYEEAMLVLTPQVSGTDLFHPPSA